MGCEALWHVLAVESRCERRGRFLCPIGQAASEGGVIAVRRFHGLREAPSGLASPVATFLGPLLGPGRCDFGCFAGTVTLRPQSVRSNLLNGA